MLTVAEVRDAAELAAHQPEWSTLVAESPDGSFFETPEWLTAWTDAFWSPRPTAFRFVRDDERLVGFAPFLPDESSDAWCRHSVTLPRHSHVPRADVVTAAGMRAEVLDALLAHARTRRAPLVFAGIDQASPLWPALGPAAHRRHLTSSTWDEPSIPWIRLGGDWDAYLGTRSSHLRSEMRRKRKKLEKSGHVDVRIVTAPDEREDAMQEIMRIERASWKQETGTSLDTEPGAAAFYDTLARRASENGWLRLYLMYLDGVPVAHIFAIVYKNDFLALKTSYDQTRRDLSPGAVLFEHALRDAFDRGYASFDLLGVEARWKNELATDVREPITLCVFSTTSIRCRSCRSLEHTVKPLLKRRAPWLASLGKSMSMRARGGTDATP